MPQVQHTAKHASLQKNRYVTLANKT